MKVPFHPPKIFIGRSADVTTTVKKSPSVSVGVSSDPRVVLPISNFIVRETNRYSHFQAWKTKPKDNSFYEAFVMGVRGRGGKVTTAERRAMKAQVKALKTEGLEAFKAKSLQSGEKLPENTQKLQQLYEKKMTGGLNALSNARTTFLDDQETFRPNRLLDQKRDVLPIMMAQATGRKVHVLELNNSDSYIKVLELPGHCSALHGEDLSSLPANAKKPPIYLLRTGDHYDYLENQSSNDHSAVSASPEKDVTSSRVVGSIFNRSHRGSKDGVASRSAIAGQNTQAATSSLTEHLAQPKSQPIRPPIDVRRSSPYAPAPMPPENDSGSNSDSASASSDSTANTAGSRPTNVNVLMGLHSLPDGPPPIGVRAKSMATGSFSVPTAPLITLGTPATRIRPALHFTVHNTDRKSDLDSFYQAFVMAERNSGEAVPANHVKGNGLKAALKLYGKFIKAPLSDFIKHAKQLPEFQEDGLVTPDKYNGKRDLQPLLVSKIMGRPIIILTSADDDNNYIESQVFTGHNPKLVGLKNRSSPEILPIYLLKDGDHYDFLEQRLADPPSMAHQWGQSL